MWDTLFTGAFRLAPKATVAALEDIAHVLPCVHCRRSYAHYVSRNPPVACSRSEEDIARWLWSVHDLVNVKLDKKVSCIPFAIVQTRQAVFTNWCSPFDPVDLLALIALQVETSEQAEAYYRLVPYFMSISTLCGAPKVDHTTAGSMPTKDLWKHAFGLCNATRRGCGLPAVDEAQFLAQYELCRAHDEAVVAPPTAPPATQGMTLRRLKAARVRGFR